MDTFNFSQEELNIYFLLSKGVKTKIIAKILNFSSRTISNKVNNVVKKLNAKNRIDALCVLIQEGYLNDYFD